MTTHRLLETPKAIEVPRFCKDAEAIAACQSLPINHFKIRGAQRLHLAGLHIAEGDALVTKLESDRHLEGRNGSVS